MIELETTILPIANGRYGVKVCTSREEVRGWIECPDRATANTIALALEAIGHDSNCTCSVCRDDEYDVEVTWRTSAWSEQDGFDYVREHMIGQEVTINLVGGRQSFEVDAGGSVRAITAGD